MLPANLAPQVPELFGRLVSALLKTICPLSVPVSSLVRRFAARLAGRCAILRWSSDDSYQL